jgi:hypothetical protein
LTKQLKSIIILDKISLLVKGLSINKIQKSMNLKFRAAQGVVVAGLLGAASLVYEGGKADAIKANNEAITSNIEIIKQISEKLDKLHTEGNSRSPEFVKLSGELFIAQQKIRTAEQNLKDFEVGIFHNLKRIVTKPE